MAQARNVAAEKQVPSPNSHALLNLLAFKNALESENKHLFSEEEVALVNHLTETIIAFEPSYLKWASEQLFNKVLPFSTQRFFFNKTFAPEHVPNIFATKCIIKSSIKEALERGVQQFVFLGNDYDIQELRISQTYKVKVFDLAFEKIAGLKLKALQQLKDASHIHYEDFHLQLSHTCIDKNYFLINHDFENESLLKKLESLGFKKNVKTLFIAAGLPKYLSAFANDKLLSDIFYLSETDNKVLISYRSNLNNQFMGSVFQYATQEPYQYALTPDKVAKSSEQKEFAVIRKMFYEDSLHWLQTKTMTSKDNSTPGLEHYYLLRKSICIKHESNIEQLPLITKELLNFNF